MKVVFLLTLTVSTHLCYSAILGLMSSQQWNFYENQIRILYDLLQVECPEAVRVERDINLAHSSVHLSVQKLQYSSLIKELIECRDKNAVSTTTKPVPPTIQRLECKNATNLTEAWRTDLNGSDIRAGGPHSNADGYACDLHEDLQWFRFTGDAGNRMSDKCPAIKSCGGIDGYWTDQEMPEVVSVRQTVRVYGSHGGADCKFHSRHMHVIRCSWDTPYDLVYRYTPPNYDYSVTPSGNPSSSCPDVFCGIK